MFSLFKSKPPRGTVTRSELREIIARAMDSEGVECTVDSVIKISSQVYSLVTEQEAFAAVRDAQTYYLPGRTVCVDTVWKAKTNIINKQGRGIFGSNHAAFGVLWTLTHAVNIFINPQRQMVLIDNDATVIRPAHLQGPVDLIVF